ncbi:MAG: GNAT family N-acetyltransferase [Methanomassiliicoccales archaeon]|nr:MAG: GNAT family N-acetyltransferase [Methanomassiliicoccales archaeon]
MSPGDDAERIEILPFKNEWLEGFLDLSAQNDSRDPLYGKEFSREEARSSLEFQQSLGIVKAHFVAALGSQIVGSAKANMPQTCGGDTSTAWLALMVSPDNRGKGIGTRLVDRICEEMASQGVGWIEIGMMDSWEDWIRFLKRQGFTPTPALRTAEVVLASEVRVPEERPNPNISIRPIRLPEERSQVIKFFNRERGEDLPRECALREDGPVWWEREPAFDPESFLVAEERENGELVGMASAYFLQEDKSEGIVGDVDVSKRLLGTGLRERLLVRAIAWLRKKGARAVRSRIHVEYRNEEELFQRLGFETEGSAIVWRRPTSLPSE